MKTLLKLAAVLVIGVVGIIAFAYSGLYDVSASAPHSGAVHWLLSTTSHASIERRARKIDVPDLSDESLVRAGVNDFEAMCVGCHGAPGKAAEAMGQGLNPPAPDLAESAARMTPAELFQVTKHGIRMTGMPAWGATHDDDAIWPVVAFMTRLPTLDADEYDAFLASAAGMGHHAGDEHGAGAHDHAMEPASGQADKAVEHDHSTHSHGDDPPQPDADESHDGHDHEH